MAVLALPAPPVSAQTRREALIEIIETGDSGGPDAAICRDFAMSVDEVRSFLARARVVTPRDVHDHHLFLPVSSAAR